MALTFLGDGTITSSVAIATINFTDLSPAIPEPARVEPRDLVRETDAGMIHGWQQAEPRRQWQLGLRLLTGAQRREIETFAKTLRNFHWCMWLRTAVSVTTGAATYVDTPIVFIYTDAYRDLVLIVTSGTGVGQIRRIIGSTLQGGGTRLTVNTAFSVTPDATSVVAVGWPVRIVGAVEYSTVPPAMHNVDMTLEEVLLNGTA